MKAIFKTVVFFTILTIITGITGCRQPAGLEETTGSIMLNIRESLSTRVLDPGLDIIPASYHITGLGPNGASFDQTTTSGSVTLNFLESGQWSVTVEALNGSGEIFAAGTSLAYVDVGEFTSITVTIRLLDGLGALAVVVEWQETEVQNPELTAFIRSGSGVDTPLNFQAVISPTTGKQRMEVNTGNTIDDGYYTLVIQVRDKGASGTGDHLALGAVEVTRILAGQTTTGFYDLTGVPIPGSLGVNVIQDFEELIEVTIENAVSLPASLAYDSGAMFTANAAIPADDENAGAVTYVWYLNGQSVGTGNSFTVDMAASPLQQNIYGAFAPGNYRLDVTAFNADASRGGSSVYEFEVTGNPVGTPSPEPTMTPYLPANEYKIKATDGSSTDYFGISVDLSTEGTAMLVGAYGDSVYSSYSGSAYLYLWNGSFWVETKFTASDWVFAEGSGFGESVAIADAGLTLLIGASGDSDNGTNSGAAYLYQWDGNSWVDTKITASDGGISDYFGSSTAISEDGRTILIGAYRADNYGVAYLYRWNGTSWIETKITSSDRASDDYFGCSIDIAENGQTLLIGSLLDDDNGSGSGSAYLYKWNGTSWIETKITPSDGAAEDYFGTAIDITEDGQTMLIGARRDDDQGTDSGSAYLYKWDGSLWIETKITAFDGAASDYFGSSAAISEDGEILLIGAYGDDDNGSSAGSVYLYQWNGTSWMERKMTASDGASEDYFGQSLSISGDGKSMLIGANRDSDNGTYSGSAYLYK